MAASDPQRYSGAPTPRRSPERRDLGALLNAYYRIEGDGQATPAAQAGDLSMDVQGFDARKYFDNMVASGRMPDLVKRAKSLDAEVRQLDGDMQRLVYENYRKFTSAAGVIKQMKFCIEGLEPDIILLEASIGRVEDSAQSVEDGVGGKSAQIDVMLHRQRLCRKLQILVALPTTLKRCLDRSEYGRAVEAYCCCSDFLRQYKSMPAFKKVLEEVEHQMNQIGSALEHRLRSPYLSVDEAVNSSLTLLDMGKDQKKVVREFICGRAAGLKQSLEHCFSSEPLTGFSFPGFDAGLPQEDSEKQELRSAGSWALHAACWRSQDSYVPEFCDAVEACQKLQEARSQTEPMDDAILRTFVRERLAALSERLLSLIQEMRPPIRVVVACVHSVRDALCRLYATMRAEVPPIFLDFLSRTASFALRGAFAEAEVAVVVSLKGLHYECKRLQESAGSGLDDVLEQIARAEQTLITSCFTVLTKCQPLVLLLGQDCGTCQQLLKEVHEHLTRLFSVFTVVCYRYIAPSPSEAPDLDVEGLSGVDELDWSGLFALALVRIGRHLETKAVGKVWSVAHQLFAEGAGLGAAEPAQPRAVIQEARLAAQAVIAQYTFVSGQRLAYFFRNSIQNKNWMTVREPRCPSVLVETVILKEVLAFDAQLARILGDPRKPRAADRRPLMRVKDEMELEIERLVAKKLQVFAQIPFNRNGAIVGILRIAFKALYEYMREETFAQFGVQQIQVDCAFLAEVVRDFVEAQDASALDSLLDEAVSSAATRCEAPVLMNPDVLEVLLSEGKQA